MQVQINTEVEQFAQKISAFFDLKGYPSIEKELIDKYRFCEKHLDSIFLKEVLTGEKNKILSRLWELIVVDNLLRNPNITIEPHSDEGLDLSIKLSNGKRYYVEMVCAYAPINSDSEIERVRKEHQESKRSSYGKELITEALTRITNSVNEKIKGYKKFIKKNGISENGYILALSYSDCPIDFFHAIQAVYPHGNMQYTIDIDKKQIMEKKFEQQSSILKKSTNKLIPTNIFGSAEYGWFSAILFSKVNLHLLLEQSEELPGIRRGEIKNDFTVCYNPTAKYLLTEDIFRSSSKISVNNNELKCEGRNIFPDY